MKTINSNEKIVSWNKFILDGDLNALSAIYFHYYNQLFAYGSKHCSNRQAVEDTIQNIFLNFIKYRENISQVKNLTGYLMSSFRHQLFLEMNQQKMLVLTDHFQDEPFGYFKNPYPDSSDPENLETMHTTIRKCVSALTAKQQEIIYLRFELGVSYEEISTLLNISVDSGYKSVYRAVQAIRTQIEKIIRVKGSLVMFFLARL
jgi:RNA polymerase sigma factor (sigma-70 family)